MFAHEAWTSARPLRGTTHVACWAKGACVAVGGRQISRLSKGTWGAATGVPDTHLLRSVACPARQRCLIGTANGDVVDAAGTKLTVIPHVLADSIDTLACSGIADCLAIGALAAPESAYFDGTSWSTSAPVGTDVVSVSCGSPAACVGVGGAVAVTASLPAQ